MLGCLQVAGSALSFDVFDARGDRRMGARFGDLDDAGRDRIQIDVGAGGQERFVVEDRDALEPPFEEGTARLSWRWPGVRVVPSSIS